MVRGAIIEQLAPVRNIRLLYWDENYLETITYQATQVQCTRIVRSGKDSILPRCLVLEV